MKRLKRRAALAALAALVAVPIAADVAGTVVRQSDHLCVRDGSRYQRLDISTHSKCKLHRDMLGTRYNFQIRDGLVFKCRQPWGERLGFGDRTLEVPTLDESCQPIEPVADTGRLESVLDRFLDDLESHPPPVAQVTTEEAPAETSAAAWYRIKLDMVCDGVAALQKQMCEAKGGGCDHHFEITPIVRSCGTRRTR